MLLMSVRIRNEKLYFRKTVTDENGSRHWLERSYPFPEKPVLFLCSEAVFNRFPEPSTAFLPLYLTYYLSITPEAVYEAKRGDYDGIKGNVDKALARHYRRVQQARMLYLHEEFSDYLVIDLRTGKRISHYQKNYISRVLKRDVDSNWSWKNWCSQKFHAP